MTAAAPQPGPQASRLIRYLADLGLLHGRGTALNLGAELGDWIDFGDSMRLAGLHDRLSEPTFEAAPVCSATLRSELQNLRLALVAAVAQSFAPAAAARIKCPTLEPDGCLQDLCVAEPYQRFYIAHQRDFDYKIQTLQLRLRDALAGVSADLARLVSLDQGLRDLLAPHIRKNLAVMPRLLGQRFEVLRQESGQFQGAAALRLRDEQSDEEVWHMWMRPDGWLNRFLAETRGLLLAELELRLLPLMGLLESLQEWEAGRC